MYKLGKSQKEFFGLFVESMEDKAEVVISKIITDIKRQHKAVGRSKAVVGLSGGIDSAVTAWLAVKALGKENVIVAKMPYKGTSSDASIGDANLMIDFLQLPRENVREVVINESVDAIIKGQEKTGAVVDSVALGNIMARVRMINLYAIANMEDGLVVDTCNFAEIVMGYFTVGGDGQADYNPMGRMPKKLVRIIAQKKGFPKTIITKMPSAELSVGQGDEADMGITYDALDLMNWLFFNNNVTEEELTDIYQFPSEIVTMVLARIANNRYKSELPPTFEIEQ